MSATTIPNVTLNDGSQVPSIAFGTGSAFFGQDAEAACVQAIETGFTHLDTAQAYENEHTLGAALSKVKSTHDRSKLYVVTKLAYIPKGQTIRDTLIKSLKDLQTTYVDLFLIHSPTFIAPYTIPAAWKEMESIQAEGLAKSIGVSNFRVKDLEELLPTAKVIPAVHQIEYHPYTVKSAEAIIALNEKHGIITEAYGGLTSLVRQKGGPVDPVVTKITDRLRATSGNKSITEGQTLLKWLEFKGFIAITTSSKKERLLEYLATPSLPNLTAEEIAEIDAAGSSGQHYRHYQRMKHMDE